MGEDREESMEELGGTGNEGLVRMKGDEVGLRRQVSCSWPECDRPA
jgi:hypothetical protein